MLTRRSAVSTTTYRWRGWVRGSEFWRFQCRYGLIASSSFAALYGAVACSDDALVLAPSLTVGVGADGTELSVLVELRSTEGVDRVELFSGPDSLRLREVGTYPSSREQNFVVDPGPFGGPRMYVAVAVGTDGARASSNVEVVDLPGEVLLEANTFDPATATFNIRDVDGADERFRWQRVQHDPDATTLEFDPDLYVRDPAPLPPSASSFTVARREPGGPTDLFVIEYRKEGQLLGISNVAGSSAGTLPLATALWPRDAAIECSWNPVSESLAVWVDGELVTVDDPSSGSFTVDVDPGDVVDVEIAARSGAVTGPRITLPMGGFASDELHGDADNACVLDSAGRVWCRGRDLYGQVGRGIPAGSLNVLRPFGPVVARADMSGPWLEGVVHIDAQPGTNIAVHDDGRVSYWGQGIHEPRDPESGEPEAVARPRLAVAADGAPIDGVIDAITGAVTCVVLVDGQVQCLGDNRSGTVGVGEVDEITAPPRTTFATVLTAPGEPLVGIVRVFSDGVRVVCAVDDGGAMWCWGDNASGRTGTGIAAQEMAHVPFATRVIDAIGPVVDVTEVVFAGATCARFVDGRVGCAGQVQSADASSFEHAYLLEVTGPWRAEWIHAAADGFVMRDATTGQWRQNPRIEGFFEPYELPGEANPDAAFRAFDEPFFVRHDGTIVRTRSVEDPLGVDFPTVGFWP